MKSLLNISEIPRKTYKKHFLSSVHCEVQFSSKVFETLFTNEENIKKALINKDLFNTSKPIIQGEFTFKNSENSPPSISQKQNPIGLNFSKTSPRNEFNIFYDKVLYSDNSYQGFDKFKESLFKLLEITSSIFSLKELKIIKVGLRKINSITIESVEHLSDALGIFNPSLFSIPRSGIMTQDTFEVSQEAVKINQNGMTCIIRTNLANTEPKKFNANLDFDIVFSQETDLNNIKDTQLDRMNQIHFNLFQWSVTPELIKLMEENS